MAVKGVEVASSGSWVKENLLSKIAFQLTVKQKETGFVPFLRSQVTVKEIRLAQFSKN